MGWMNINPELFFTPLAESADFKRIAFLFLVVGLGFLIAGYFLQARDAQTADQKKAVLMKVMVLLVLIPLAPSVVGLVRSGAYSVQTQMQMNPPQVASRCMAMALQCPELDSILKAVGSDAADMEGTQARAADRYGSTFFGRWMAGLSGMMDVLKNPKVLWRYLQNLLVATAHMVIKMVLLAITYVFFSLVMIVVGVLAVFMSIMQEFILMMAVMMLPMFLGFFMYPGWGQHARTFCLHTLGVATWPIAWTFGNFGTMALFNFTASSLSGVLLNAAPGSLNWDTNLANTQAMLDTASKGGVEGATTMASMSMEVMTGAVALFIVPIVSLFMLMVWAFYVYVKLPWSWNQVLISGADMVGQSIMGAMSTAGSALGRVAQTAVQLGAAAATGGAAAAGGAAGAAAGGGAASAFGGGGFRGALQMLGQTLIQNRHAGWDGTLGQALNALGGGGAPKGGNGGDSHAAAMEAADKAAAAAKKS